MEKLNVSVVVIAKNEEKRIPVPALNTPSSAERMKSRPIL